MATSMIRTWKDNDQATQTRYRTPLGGEVRVWENSVHYIVFDAADEDAAIDYVIANAPATYRNFPITKVAVEERRATTEWIVVVSYGERESRGGGGSPTPGLRLNFHVGGGTVLRREALDLIAFGGAQSPGWLLNPDNEGNPQGLEVTAPALSFSLTKTVAPNAVTWAWLREVAQYAGSVNLAAWNGFGAGELLFEGIEGNTEDLGKEEFDLGFNFSAAPAEQKVTLQVQNAQGTVAPQDVYLHGWEYLNVRAAPGIQNENGVNKREPVVTGYSTCAVYPKKDWSNFLL